MAQSVGAVALDIVMGKNTVSSVAKQAILDVQKTFSDSSSTIGTKVSAVGQACTALGASMLPASTAVAGLGGSMVKTAANFDSSMSEVQAISGATGKDFDALRDKAQEMGAKTKFSASQSAEAMKYMAMAGWKTEDMLSGISGVMNLAAASGEDLGTTSDIVTDALTAFGLSASDSGHFADVLAATSSNANTNVSMMGETFKYCAPVAGALGYSVEDVSVAVGLMANAGIKGSQAGTALRSVMTRLSSPPKECAAAMEKLGISITNADGTMKPLSTVMSELTTAFSGLGEAEQAQMAKAIGGQEAMSGLLAIVNAAPSDVDKLQAAIYGSSITVESFNKAAEEAGVPIDKMRKAFEEAGVSSDDFDYMLQQSGGDAELFADCLSELTTNGKNSRDILDSLGITTESLQTAMDNSTGCAEKMADTMNDNLNGRVTLLKSQLEGLAIDMGERLVPMINVCISAVSKVADWFGGLDESTKQIIVTVGTLVAAAAPVLLIIGKIISIVGSAVSVVGRIGGAVSGFVGLITGTVIPAMSGLFAFLLANPIVLVIAAIVGAIALLIANWNKVKQVTMAVWGAIKNAVSVAVKAIKTVITTYFNAIKTVITNVVGVIKTIITTYFNIYKTVITTIVRAIKTVITTVWNAIKTVITNVVNAIKTVVTTYFNAVKTVITTIVNAIKTVITTVWNTIKTVIATVVNAIKTVVTTVWNAIKTVITTILNTIKSVVSSVWNGIKNTISSVLNGIKNVVSSVFNAVFGTIRSAMSNITSAVTGGFNNVKSKITGLAKQAVTWGKDMVMGIVKGIKDSVGKVGDAAKGVADKIKSFLHFSRPDVGPLREYESWMPDFVGGMAKGIENNKYKLINSIKGMAAEMTVNPVQAPLLRNVGTTDAPQPGATKENQIIDLLKKLLGNPNPGNGGNITIPIYLGNDLIDERIISANDSRTIRSGGRA